MHRALSAGLSLLGLLVVASTSQAQEPVVDSEVRVVLTEALTALAVSPPAPSLAAMLETPVEAPGGATLAPVGRRPLDPIDIHRRLAASVLVLGKRYTCDSCSADHLRTASAFVVASEGIAVTNRHVVDGDDALAVVGTADGRTGAVLGIIATDPVNDLALIRIGLTDLPALPLAPERPATGAALYLLSHPGEHYFVFAAGLVSRLSRRTAQSPLHLDVDLPYAKGSSGAPLVDDRGNVVSIVHSTEFIPGLPEGGELEHPQMVLGSTIPVEALIALLGTVLEP